MEEQHEKYFFDLSTFEHAEIFATAQDVWIAISKISSYLKQQHLLGKIHVDIPDGAFLINPELISIGEGTIVEPGAYIAGPAIIGKNCRIRQGAYIRGNLITGDGCVIGHTSEVKNSIFLNNSCAAHFAYIGDSILGNRVNLGAGTICANLRLDQNSIKLHIMGRVCQTGLRKFGSIIGDNTQIGCNSVINPGTLIGKDVLTHPCLNLGGFIASNSLVQTPHKPTISIRNLKKTNF